MLRRLEDLRIPFRSGRVTGVFRLIIYQRSLRWRPLNTQKKGG